mgnify:CR=1 FL=1
MLSFASLRESPSKSLVFVNVYKFCANVRVCNLVCFEILCCGGSFSMSLRMRAFVFVESFCCCVLAIFGRVFLPSSGSGA